MADLRISDLVTASQLKDDDYYEIAQAESGTRVSYRTTLLAIAVQIATVVQLTSDLTTDSKTLAGAINELKQKISLIPKFSIDVVQTLPTEDISDTTIYLVPAEDPEVGNYYEEYIHVNDAWELVGTTAVDLSAYYTKLEVDAKFSELATVATSGSYNDLTNKPDLSALMDVNETTFTNPYTKKLVPSGKYTEKLRKIVGASIVWNQLVQNGNFADTSWWETYKATLSVSGNVGTLTSTEANTSPVVRKRFDLINGHKYLAGLSVNPSKELQLGASLDYSSITNNAIIPRTSITANTWTEIKGVIAFDSSATTSTNSGIRFSGNGNQYTGTETIQIKNFILVDLTAMFGTTIADYVYTLETQTAGSGIVWLKSYGFFTEDYYAYSANTIQSVSVSAKVNKDSEDTTISTVALDHTELRGLFKLDANNNLYADGDEYPSDGSGTTNYSEISVGDFFWTKISTQGGDYVFYCVLPNRVVGFDFMCENYPNSYTDRNNMPNKTCGNTNTLNNTFCIRDDDYANETEFKNALSSMKIIYKATPTTASLTPYQSLQNIESGGTEEFVDYGVQSSTRDVAIPAGNETAYGDNENMGKIINYINT